jgi:hypothetical protein
MKADIAGKTFASGLLPELIAALRLSRPGIWLPLPMRTKSTV